eukprot:m.865517 g.865517  ORF g.865517 m.865517 type:complete len:64 (+) comp59718_c0_seq1:1122-1313(+)
MPDKESNNATRSLQIIIGVRWQDALRVLRFLGIAGQMVVCASELAQALSFTRQFSLELQSADL